MWQGIAICLSLLGAEEVTVKPLHGESVRGDLVSLTEKTLVIGTTTGEVKWDANAVQSLKPGVAATSDALDDKSATNVFVELTDNSTLVGDRVTLADGKAALEVAKGKSLEVSNRVIRNVRFRRQHDELQKQWNAIAAGTFSGDQLVVRKVGTDSTTSVPMAVVLDQLEGVVHGVTATSVMFEFDGDKINVPLEKVEGIIFYQRQKEAWPDPICQVRDLRGGEWHLQMMQFTNGVLTVQTVAGVRGELRWDRVAEVDFSTGNLVYLSDLKPESSEWRPYLITPATPPALAKWFSWRRDQTTDGSVLTLAGQSHEKGLSIHSRTLLSYRLTKDFRHFQALAGIDEKFRGPANLKLVITGDDRTLLSRDVRGNDAPFEFDLDVSGVRRLKVLVDFGEDRSDAGDHLLLCNARLTK